jgi:cyclopropane-fatty-acyl-phospholipid synthase
MRIGIRRLLAGRLKQIATRSNDSAVDDFLRRTRSAPIALATQRANQQHYEVPAEFFQQVLGPRLKYSCCYWPDGVESLLVAEECALQKTCEHADLRDGMRILELGCGWGSLSLWMAEKYPNSQITAVSNSHSQRKQIEQCAAQRSLNNLQVVTADMNDFEPAPSFDRVVSVEMFEHMRNHGELMRRISGWLRPGGRLLVHIFCHRTTPYLYDSVGEHNWMGRYFFSGGMMPSVDLLPRSAAPLELLSTWKWNGRHYARTCQAWLTKLDAASPRLKKILTSTYGDADANRWRHRWRMFFMACQEIFSYRRGEEWFVSHYLFEKPHSSD